MKIRHAAIFLALPLLCTTAQANSFLHYAGEFNFRTGEKQNNVTIAGLSAITFDAKKNIFYAINDSRNNNKEGDASLYTLKIHVFFAQPKWQTGYVKNEICFYQN